MRDANAIIKKSLCTTSIGPTYMCGLHFKLWKSFRSVGWSVFNTKFLMKLPVEGGAGVDWGEGITGWDFHGEPGILVPTKSWGLTQNLC